MQKNWQDFLAQPSTATSDKLVLDIEKIKTIATRGLDENTYCDLSQFDVLTVSGEDAGEFLHAQLSSDVAALEINEAQLSSWCNIKGRVIVSFLLYRHHDHYYLLLEKEMTEQVHKRLQMFVLRSNVNIVNESERLIRIGICGLSAHNQIEEFIQSKPEAISISLKISPNMSIVVCPVDLAKELWSKLQISAQAIASENWSLYNILTGITWIGISESEEFLPQSLNMDLIGALSFDKGCYPGQEIIARMHFRGKLKQRLFLAHARIEKVPAHKTKLFIAETNAHIGMVAKAFMNEAQSCMMLVVLDIELAESAAIHLDSDEGSLIEILPLPYSHTLD